ncbi:methyltransferase [Pseudomonas chlororaphis]|uniref:methyltransferase n=1 Tax=Pseudomonas chlororaphis TaxID=587753 RepID=UPI0030D2999D
MFSRLFKRPAPPSPPLFAIRSLQLSEKVQWLAGKGLIDPMLYVQRHLHGDWGDIGEAESQANAVALNQNGPLYSRYQVTPCLYLAVITDDSHSTTIIQLPEERALL